MKENEVRGQSSHDHRLAALSLGALGVVFGDIGTSPLYAFKEAFGGQHALPLSEANVFGVLSLIFWAVMLIVSVKYVTFVLRFDNKGEGGVLALLALASQLFRKNRRLSQVATVIAVFAASLFYGDAVITPAISVLFCGHARAGALDRARNPCNTRRRVCAATLWHRKNRPPVRAGDDDLVFYHRRLGRDEYFADPGHPEGA